MYIMQAYSPAYKTNNHISQQYIDNYNITAITSLMKYSTLNISPVNYTFYH